MPPPLMPVALPSARCEGAAFHAATLLQRWPMPHTPLRALTPSLITPPHCYAAAADMPFCMPHTPRFAAIFL